MQERKALDITKEALGRKEHCLSTMEESLQRKGKSLLTHNRDGDQGFHGATRAATRDSW